MKKNVASQVVGAQMVSASDGSAFTGPVTCHVTGDGGTQATGSVGSGACTHEGNGFHTYAPAQAETNYDHVAFTFVGTGAVPATVQIYTTFPQTGDNFARLGAPVGASVSADIAAVKSDSAAILVDTGTSGVLLAATATSAQLVDDVWDEVLTAATHNVATSAGRRLRQIAGIVIHDGTAQAGGTNSITLDTGASATDGAYDPAAVVIVGGTGAGQTRLITQYVGSTRVATVDRDWKVTPDNTSLFQIQADAGREHVNEGLAQGGTATSITLNALASSTDDAYNGQICFIRSGTGADQTGVVVDYNGTTKVATVATAMASGQWAVTPDSTSGYVMLPSSPVVLAGITHSGAEVAIATGGIASTSFAAGAIDNAAIAANAIGASEFAQDAAQEIADEVLNRNLAGGGSGNTRNVRNALRSLRNRAAIAAGTLTVYQEDDTTSAWTAAVTTTAGDPLSEVDPT